MDASKIAEMLKGVLRLAEHDAAIEEWSKKGQTNAEFWRKDDRDYWFPVKRAVDQEGLDKLKSWGTLRIKTEDSHASFVFGDYLVWYSSRWGWGVEYKSSPLYRSSDPNYYSEDIPQIPLALARK